MTCKDCIHYEACHDMYYEEHATRHFDPEKHNAEKECGYFKDRSRFVELPCDIISKAEIKRELNAQCAVKKIDVETAKDMLENLPYIRVNTKQELKECETIPNNITPEAALIELNRIRTNTGERPPEIDMAIRAINRVFVKRKPEPELRYYGIGRCPNCGVVFIGGATNHCSNCGQALDWDGGKSE